MFTYSIVFLLVTCFTQIRAPTGPGLTEVKKQEFNDWKCESICNDPNEATIRNLCIRLFSPSDPIGSVNILENSNCGRNYMKLKNDYNDKFDYYQKTVGFCDTGAEDSEKKCITKSKGTNDLLVWDYGDEDETGQKYCSPEYELKGWLTSNAAV